jgi:hypothetical protein
VGTAAGWEVTEMLNGAACWWGNRVVLLCVEIYCVTVCWDWGRTVAAMLGVVQPVGVMCWVLLSEEGQQLPWSTG